MQPDKRSHYHAFRHRALCVVLLLVVVLAAFQIWNICHSHQPFNWENAKKLLPAIACLCIWGCFCWRTRHAATEEKLAGLANGYEPVPPKPSFLWQAVLILLPVALMAGFGFWAILRERNAVEEEALQRAQAIIQSLPGEFDRLAANRLTQFEFIKNGWLDYLTGAVATWPEDKTRKQWLDDTNAWPSFTNNLAVLHSAFPQWQSGPVPLASVSLDTNGDLLYYQPVPARPPAWLATQKNEKKNALAALQAAACAPASLNTLTSLFQSFRSTKPPAPALACADFWLLRRRLASQPVTNAMEQLLQFGGQHGGEVSDSGVPLSTLALADALRVSRVHGPNQQLWEALQSEIATPSALAPRILEEAGSLVARDQKLTDAVQALSILLANNLAQVEFAQAVKDSGQFKAFTPSSFWLEAQGQRWFCLLRPTTSVTYRANSPTTNFYVAVNGYHPAIVGRGFADALSDAKVSLPDYFSLALNLEGEAIPLPAPWSKAGVARQAGDLLVEGHFALRQPALLNTVGPSGVPQEIPFEAMPSHPQFTLQIWLTNRPLLHARQRQLQYIFGALIGASATAALVGFIAAYRAFRREQELNDLKSNFVSSVSHELRAPIASVRLMAENLESGKIPAAEKQREYFKFIVQECRRLSSLIENVLDFSRIEKGRKHYDLEPTDLGALVRTTVKLMEPYALERAVSLRLEDAQLSLSPNVEAKVDGRAMQQALVNLIDNAIKHSAAGLTVSVALVRWDGPGGAELHFQVTDQGPGIPAAEQEKIFVRFYRRGSELRRETAGIGIGLSLVKHIVEAHGGRVTVQSTPGRGSRFTLEIPVRN